MYSKRAVRAAIGGGSRVEGASSPHFRAAKKRFARAETTTCTAYGGVRRVGCLAFLLFGFLSLLGGRTAGQLTVTYQRQVSIQ